jgi:hypothetical protein
MMTKIREKSEEEVSAWKMDKEATKPRSDGGLQSGKRQGKLSLQENQVAADTFVTARGHF